MTKEINSLLKRHYPNGLPNFRNVVALGGERRRGKSTLAKALVNQYEGFDFAFADEVRDLSHELFPWFNPYNEAFKEVIYPHSRNTQEATGRDILLTVGKLRDVDDYYFLDRFIQSKLQAAQDIPNKLFIISDFRTETEYRDFLLPLNIPIIKIVRDVQGLTPQPFEDFIRTFTNCEIFHNNTDDPQKFLDFFPQFAKSKGMVFDGL